MINIRRITIKNFRQYKNVDLKFNNKTGLNLIALFVLPDGSNKSPYSLIINRSEFEDAK